MNLKKPKSLAAFLTPPCILLFFLFGFQSGGALERIGTATAMSTVILNQQESFEPKTRTILLAWIENQRKALERDRKWTLSSRKKRLDQTLSQLRECKKRLNQGFVEHRHATDG